MKISISPQCTRGLPTRAAVLGALLAGGPAAAQWAEGPRPPDSVTIAANAAYDAGSLRRFLLGHDYRDLWAAPLRVPVLDLDGFAGGLTFEKRGGRKQTRSIHFRGADGREYLFRSVDKEPRIALAPALQGTLAGWLVRDQTAALLPAGNLAVPPLLEAAGVIHVTPRLAVMPDDARLGEAREEFAGMLGTIEERPNEGGEGDVGLQDSVKIIGSDRLRERLRESSQDRVDARAFLTARLMDALMNDRDRHWDQWRWIEVERDGTRWWRPIPEDRDFVFVDFNGLGPSLARRVAPHLVAFGPGFPGVAALSHNSLDLDRQLLAELPREAWESIAAALRQRLTDDVVTAAAGHLPDAYRALAGDRLERNLRARRDRLPELATRWYAWLSTEVDVIGTDEPELAVAEYLPDGALLLSLYLLDDDEPSEYPYFSRRFLPAETREVRIFLNGGIDRTVVYGARLRHAIAIRVVGGSGGDLLTNFSTGPRDGRLSFHDASGEDSLNGNAGAVLDTLASLPTAGEGPLSGMHPRDFGGHRVTTPLLNYGTTLGLVVGARLTWTRYGFRQVPYSQAASASAAYSFERQAIGFEFQADRRRPDSRRGVSVVAQATQLEAFHFFGMGNDTPEHSDDDRFLIERDLVRLHPALDFHFLPRSRLSFGPVVEYSNLYPRAGVRSLDVPLSTGEFGQIGGRAALTLDLRDQPALPRSGVYASFDASAYAGTGSGAGAFGQLQSALSTYLSPLNGRGPTLALRVGAEQVWGDFPPYAAAFLGGWRTLRGYESERFAGDAALWGGAELRVPLARVPLLVRGDLGVLAFVDAGRVFVDGESPGGWHSGSGGGLYFACDVRGTTVSATTLFARGEEDRFRIQLGVPF